MSGLFSRKDNLRKRTTMTRGVVLFLSYCVAKKRSYVNYRFTDVTTRENAKVFHVVNIEPFHTWNSGNVSDPPLDVLEDSALWGEGGSCHESTSVRSCDYRTDNVCNLLESDVRVSLSDLFNDVSGEGMSKCVDPIISCDLTEDDVDCVD